SGGDGRRRYVKLRRGALASLAVPDPGRCIPVGPALFVCSANSAPSPLAAALWRRPPGQPAPSAGTRPPDLVPPGAAAAALRAGLGPLTDRPRALPEAGTGDRDGPVVVVTVCDRAHEELAPDGSRLHWSIPDPVAAGTDAAFDAAVAGLAGRIRD